MLKYLIIGIILVGYTLNANAEVYILEENNKINTLNDQYIITEKIISDILFDNNNLYFASKNNVYIANKTSKVISSKTKIDNISKLVQDENYLYISSKNILYKIYKVNGSFALKQILTNNILDIFTGYWYCYNCTITYINNSYYTNGTGNFTNYFDEIFINKISANTTPFININNSMVLNKSSFILYSPSYLSSLEIANNNLTLFYWNNENYSEIDMDTNANIISIRDGNSTSVTEMIQSANFYQWIINTGEVLKLNEYGTIIHNKVTLDELSGSDKYLKVNSSGELYTVTPTIYFGSNYTNMTKMVGNVYYNSYDVPIYLVIRVGCLATVGNLDCNVRLLNNNKPVNQHYLSPMTVNQYYVHSFANIIPSGSNYSLVNNGTAQLLLYDWYENNITVQP